MHAEDKDLNVEKSLWQSYRGLEADQQRRFRLLGVLAREGSFDLKLAAALWGETEAAADLPMEALLDADLVQTATEGRYQQHRLLHAYARALLHREGEYEAAFGRYADWVIAFSQQFDELPPEQWSVLELDLPHVHEVGDGLVERTAGDASTWQRSLDFAYSITRYLAHRRQVRRLDWLEMGLNAARHLATQHPDEIDSYRRRESLFLNELGGAWSALGEKRKALEFYEQALPLRRAVGDRGGEAVTCYNMGMIYHQLGDLDQAIAYVERCVELDIQVEHPDLESDRRTLEQLKALRDGASAPADPRADFARQIMALYQGGGAAAVRQALGEAGAAPEVIEGIVQQVEEALKG
jgi:tetratricopeptide (TPR) repeat protein